MGKNIAVKYNHDGGQVSIKLEFSGDFFAEYLYELWSATDNSKADEQEGNNNNPQDDIFYLPTPLILNKGRLAKFTISFLGRNENHPDYEICAKVFQDNNELGVASDAGSLSFQEQDLTLRISLLV